MAMAVEVARTNISEFVLWLVWKSTIITIVKLPNDKRCVSLFNVNVFVIFFKNNHVNLHNGTGILLLYILARLW